MPTSNTPQVAINDIGTAEDFLAAVDATMRGQSSLHRAWEVSNPAKIDIRYCCKSQR